MAPADELVESDPRPMPAEFQYLMVVVALFTLLLLAGVPGQEVTQVGEHSIAPPQRAWASRWTARVLAEQAAQAGQPAPATQPAPLDSTPQR